MEPICVAPTGDRCGEGPVWHSGEQVLYWTDISRFLIHRFDPLRGDVTSWFFDEPVTALMLTDRDDTLAVALGSRVIFWQPRSDSRRDQGFRLTGWPAVRLNDGRADPHGSLWVGSMRNNVRIDGTSCEAGGADGILFRIDPDGGVSEWKHGIGISNTFVWSPDQECFYFADTLANEIYAYDYNGETGTIDAERVWFSGFPRGLPDGSAVDRDGYLWNCRYGGKCIVRLAPDGRINRILEMPVTNATSCTFGGAEYRTLYITSAAADAPPEERFSGGVFALRTETPGQPENRFHVDTV